MEQLIGGNLKGVLESQHLCARGVVTALGVYVATIVGTVYLQINGK